MKRERTGLACLAVLIALLCLAGCGLTRKQSAAPPHEGAWYFAKNGVACQIGQGKIYEDDLHAKEGQTLRGVYSEMDGYIEAHMAGVGGVQVPHALYVVQTGQGEVLCDDPSGDGTVYFYRDALTALEALEVAEAVPSPTPILTPSEIPTPPGTLPPLERSEPAVDEPPSQVMPGLDDEPLNHPSSKPSSKALPSWWTPPSLEPLPSPVTKGGGNMVWVPQSGSKYHNTSSCSGMKNPSQITKAEAERQGYTPCKRCY